MQENIAQNPELFRTSLRKFQTENDRVKPDEPKREYFVDSLSKEVLSLKSKMAELQISHEGNEANLKRVAQENKQKWNSIQDQVNAEIQTMGLMKERIALELDIVKKQMGLGATTLLNDMKQQQQFGNENQSSMDKGTHADIKYLLTEFDKMRSKMESMEKRLQSRPEPEDFERSQARVKMEPSDQHDTERFNTSLKTSGKDK